MSSYVFIVLSVVVFIIHLASPLDTDVKPHIIFILADDLGWNDASFHGSPEIPTPNIDALAASGVVLQHYYAAPQCTPSRGSFMTGRYAVNIGLQHFVLTLGSPSGLPLNFTILPQYLKTLGYATAMVGKWHLGYCKKDYTPLYRGFDKFFGYLNYAVDYFDYTIYRNFGGEVAWGVDLYDGLDIQKNIRGQYAPDLFTDKAIEMIQSHNASEPLFLYVSQISPHHGNSYNQLQAKPETVAKFKYIKDLNRRTYAGMVKSLDESVGRIFHALKEKGLLDNSIVVFASDNGGTSVRGTIGPGSNWPLRGEKFSLWEGGVRVPALIWSPLLELKEPVTSDKLMHVSDWLPTLYSAAGGDVEELGDIDGFNMWPHLSDSSLSPREGVLLNIDHQPPMSAIRVGDYKLIQGDYPNIPNKWQGPSGRLDVPFNSSLDEWVWKDGSVVKDILEEAGWWLVKSPDSWRVNLTVHCGSPPSSQDSPCDPTKGACLYNIVRDPCEYNDLSHHYPRIVKKMQELISQYESASWPPVAIQEDLSFLPLCHGFAYVPWLDEEHQNNCSSYFD